MSIPWGEHYTYKLRKLVGGKLPLMLPSVRAIIRDEEGKVLFIERRKRIVAHSNEWGMPAGGLELNESIYDCLIREVKEETGLDIVSATLIAVYTGAKGLTEKGKMIEFCFSVDEWFGTLLTETTESTDAKFYPLNALPQASNEFWHNHHLEVFADMEKYGGNLILK